MKKLALSLILLLGFGLVSLHAADFWETKDFKDWKPKEVQRMLTNSPWTRTVSLSMGGSFGGMGGRMGGGMDASQSSGRVPGMGGGGGGRRGNRSSGMDMDEMRPSLNVYVRWLSALPVRQALVRNNFGDEVTGEAAMKLLELEDERYIIAVAGLPARMAMGRRDGSGQPRNPEMTSEQRQQQRQAGPPTGALERIKDKATIRVKGKDPIHPNHVEMSGSQQNSDIYLFFPRGNDGGLDIVLEDKEVEFLLDLERSDVKRKFKLKDMVYQGKLEL